VQGCTFVYVSVGRCSNLQVPKRGENLTRHLGAGVREAPLQKNPKKREKDAEKDNCRARGGKVLQVDRNNKNGGEGEKRGAERRLSRGKKKKKKKKNPKKALSF